MNSLRSRKERPCNISNLCSSRRPSFKNKLLNFECDSIPFNYRSQISTRPYMSTINSFLCLLGVSRAAGLFIDPYGLKRVSTLIPVYPAATLFRTLIPIQSEVTAEGRVITHGGCGESFLQSPALVMNNKVGYLSQDTGTGK